MAESWMIQGFGSEHQVFITNQRPEIDNYFYNRLELDLQFNNVNFYSDREIDREGREEIFMRRIEESKIVILIFSERCTESTWWLRQLIMIKEYVAQRQLVAFPVFYKLDESTVNDLTGKSKRVPREEWEKALTSLLFNNRNNIAVEKWDRNLPKWAYQPMLTKADERRFARTIVTNVKRELKQQRYYEDLGEKLVAIIGCLVFLYFSILVFRISALSDEGGGAIVVDVPKVLECIPPERTDITIGKDSEIVKDIPKVLESIPVDVTENVIDKDGDFLTSKDGAKPVRSSSDAKTNIDVLDSKIIPPQIQVFINFRGVQLRNNFVGYLAHALRKREVNVFIDDYEKRGEDLNSLFKRIDDSGIAIVVFSSRYTESKWCLEELVKIKDRVHQSLLKVIPIFYKVSPTDVKRLKGEFGDHFKDQEHMYGSDSPLIKAWKEAIVSVTHKHALVFDEKSRELEVDFIETIVKEVLEMIQSISKVESSQSSSQPIQS